LAQIRVKKFRRRRKDSFLAKPKGALKWLRVEG
jgi:hypothetical protein